MRVAPEVQVHHAGVRHEEHHDERPERNLEGWVGSVERRDDHREQDDRDQPERGVQVPDARKSSPRLRAREDAIAHAERYRPQA